VRLDEHKTKPRSLDAHCTKARNIPAKQNAKRNQRDRSDDVEGMTAHQQQC
jgi:hypothetical protein